MPPLSAPDPWIGRCIGESDRYRLQERLGGGSMGDVFIALDTRIGQIVAIKILKSHWAETDELRRRFEHEVALCAALKSEHVVRVSDYGVTPDGHPYYVMEYLTGKTLGDLMRQQGGLSVKQAVNFITQVCNGLERAHSGIMLPNRGEMIKVVHRDLKPDNIFIAESSLGPLVKILDFGIAKIQHAQRDSTMATNMFIGTFHYASPEQVEVRQELDGRSDIYSLGVILYEMLAGIDPFGLSESSATEISQMTWAVAHASKPVIPLRNRPACAHVSPQLEAVVMRCLEKNPDDRFATVQELKDALSAAMLAETDVPTVSSRSEATAVQPAGTWVQPVMSPTVPEKSALPIAQTQVSPPTPIPAPPSPSPKPKGLSPLLPLILGFVGAIGISALVLWQLKPGSPPSPATPTPTSTPSVVDWFAQAMQQGAAGDLPGAIATAQKVPADSPNAAAAQQKIEAWSRTILTAADTELRQKNNTEGALDQAIKKTQAIPATAGVVYAEAQSTVKQWQTDWNTAKAAVEKAREASSTGNWNAVLAATQNLPQIYYWQMQAKSLNEKAQAELAKPAPVAPPEPTYVPPVSQPDPSRSRPTQVPRRPEPAPVPPPVPETAPSASPPIYVIPSDAPL